MVWYWCDYNVSGRLTESVVWVDKRLNIKMEHVWTVFNNLAASIPMSVTLRVKMFGSMEGDVSKMMNDLATIKYTSRQILWTFNRRVDGGLVKNFAPLLTSFDFQLTFGYFRCQIRQHLVGLRCIYLFFTALSTEIYFDKFVKLLSVMSGGYAECASSQFTEASCMPCWWRGQWKTSRTNKVISYVWSRRSSNPHKVSLPWLAALLFQSCAPRHTIHLCICQNINVSYCDIFYIF